MSALLLLAAEKKFWILDPLYAAFGTVLAWIYSVIPSYGVAIMLLTVAVSVLRMPLVKKQVKSQQEMQRIQPELKRIQAKYKNEPQKRNEEMMKLYKEHDVNPFAGCLPLFLQLPLMIVLYRVILGLGRVPPKHIPHSSDLFGALQAAGGKMESFGMDLAQSAARATGFGTRLPYFVLIALVVGTGLFQQRQMTARLPKDAQNSQMAVMGKIFPAFFGLISYSIPAGVVLYFFVSNVWQIGQQAVLFRKQDEEKAAGGKGGKAAKPKVEELPASDGAGATSGGSGDSAGAGGSGGAGGAGAGGAGGAGGGSARKAGAGKAGAGSGKKSRAAKRTKPVQGKTGAGGARGAGGGGGKSAGGKSSSGKAPAARGGRGLFAGFGAGKAAGRNGGRSVRKTDRRPTDGKDGSGPNGRTSSKGGTGRAQPKGTNPQGRPRKGK